MKIREMRAITASATQGPWLTINFARIDDGLDGVSAVGPVHWNNDKQAQADQDFIVMARNKMDKLLDLVEAVDNHIEAIQQWEIWPTDELIKARKAVERDE